MTSTTPDPMPETTAKLAAQFRANRSAPTNSRSDSVYEVEAVAYGYAYGRQDSGQNLLQHPEPRQFVARWVELGHNNWPQLQPVYDAMLAELNG